ncbi:hypothetical protein Cp1R7AA1_036 [Mesorhizobium phage Cp1R7A-A1]|nr:hypothetical protein Cp1R7AA1_036 [Mesorhizobium phage Cp1R7A-A1]
MTESNWMDEERLHVPSLWISEDADDEIEMVDTGKVDADGQPIVIALSHKQGFAGFIPPGEYARIQRAKAKAKAEAELLKIIETAVTATLTKLGIVVDPAALKAAEKASKARSPARAKKKTK